LNKIAVKFGSVTQLLQGLSLQAVRVNIRSFKSYSSRKVLICYVLRYQLLNK